MASNYFMRRVVAFLICTVLLAPAGMAEVKPLALGGYGIEQDVTIDAPPDVVYSAATGDISGWWDHSFSTHPARIYIEAKPGGGFYEIFDASGDGVQHATVIWAERGKKLRFVGPLGMAGNAVDFVTTWDFKSEGSGTRMHVTCNIAGQIAPETPKLIDQIWHHFLVERLKPYVESGEYRKKQK